MSYTSNMYDTFEDTEFSYYSSSSFDNRTKEYLLDKYSPRASWDYLDTVDITFNLQEVTSLSANDLQSLEGKNIIIQFYDFKLNPIEVSKEISAASTFVFSIDYETSMLYFKKGTYYCSLQLIEYNDDEEKTIKDSKIILAPNDCCFYVK